MQSQPVEDAESNDAPVPVATAGALPETGAPACRVPLFLDERLVRSRWSPREKAA